jgi:hypothetical protein
MGRDTDGSNDRRPVPQHPRWLIQLQPPFTLLLSITSPPSPQSGPPNTGISYAPGFILPSEKPQSFLQQSRWALPAGAQPPILNWLPWLGAPGQEAPAQGQGPPSSTPLLYPGTPQLQLLLGIDCAGTGSSTEATVDTLLPNMSHSHSHHLRLSPLVPIRPNCPPRHLEIVSCGLSQYRCHQSGISPKGS